MEALEIAFGVALGLLFALVGYILILVVGAFCFAFASVYWKRMREKWRVDRRSPEQKVRDLRRSLGYDD